MSYDFGSDDEDTTPTDSETVEGTCEDLTPQQVVCQVDGGAPAACQGAIDVVTEQIAASAGCTPAGQALGIVSFETAGADAGPIDLYAWVEPGAGEDAPFADEAYLSVFEDDCGDDPFGEGDLPVCAYEPWLVTPDIHADAPVYAHLQTLAPANPGEPLVLGYQLRASDSWTWSLPADEELFCLYPIDSPDPGPQSTAFLDSPLWDSAWHPIDLTGAPPALHGAPRICPGGSAGWRQAAFQLRNQGDDPLLVTEIRVARRLPSLSLEVVPFHFEIASCTDSIVAEGGVIVPEQDPLASSCHDDGEHASKAMELEIVPWIPMLPSTQYTLMIQVPPSAGTALEVRLQTEPH